VLSGGVLRRRDETRRKAYCRPDRVGRATNSGVAAGPIGALSSRHVLIRSAACAGRRRRHRAAAAPVDDDPILGSGLRAYRQLQPAANGFNNVVRKRTFNDTDIDVRQLSSIGRRARPEKRMTRADGSTALISWASCAPVICGSA
jgi:hypothetical protein